MIRRIVTHYCTTNQLYACMNYINEQSVRKAEASAYRYEALDICYTNELHMEVTVR